MAVEFRPDHAVTVYTVFRALTTERALLPRLLQVSALPAPVRVQAEAYAAAISVPATRVPAVLTPA